MKAAHLLIFVLLFGCRDRQSSDNALQSDVVKQIESLDISPDDKKVLLLSTHDGVSTMFEVNADGGSPTLILKSSEGEIFSNPRYSPNKEKIVFIKHLKKTIWESTVCISNNDGTNIQELTHGGELVTEAVFSTTGENVLYCSTKQYNTSKKKGTSDAREFDIYTVNINDRKPTKLSTLDALGIEDLQEINEKYILFHMTAGKKSGIYSIEKDNPHRAQKLLPLNVMKEPATLDNPGYTSDGFIVFTSQSELYAIDLNTNKADLIFDAKGGHFIEMLRGFHKRSRVLFKKFDESELTSVNTDGTEVKSIEIEFPH